MNRELRSIPTTFTTREEGNDLIIDAYFAVYNSNYDIAPGMSESIAPGAFTKSLDKDVRCLLNHDTTLVLGRTTAHTFELRDDEHGLFGSVVINREDSDAMNAYARVNRGDVSQCSIGMRIVEESTDTRDDGGIHWTIRDAELVECSLCTFPAYKETNASTRAEQRDAFLKREADAWKLRQKERLEVIRHGSESADDEEKD